MSINSMKEIVESFSCDACGKVFNERNSCSLTFRAGDDITFEWWNTGDYCPECLCKLADGIVNRIPVAERYMSHNLKIPMELAVIRDGDAS